MQEAGCQRRVTESINYYLHDIFRAKESHSYSPDRELYRGGACDGSSIDGSESCENCEQSDSAHVDELG
jgi:hypothetical protein